MSQGSVAVASVVFTTDFLDYVFCSHNIEKLCNQKYQFMGFSLLISLVMVIIENLACFAYISFLAIIAILSSVITIYYYDLSFIFDRSLPIPEYSLSKLGGISSFIGVALFAMEVIRGVKQGIGMVFPIRASMKDISGYRSIYSMTMVLVFIICCVFGFLSYLVGLLHSRHWATRCLQ